MSGKTIRFKLVFLRGPMVMAEVVGIKDMLLSELTVEDIDEKVIQTEQYLERITGLRVHINQVEE